MEQEKIFSEVGLGNESFISTEIEKGKKEYRLPKFIKPKITNGVYLRVWIFKKVLILSTYSGIKVINRNNNKFKLILGLEGVGLNKELLK